ncbi:hypothetical protein EXIGLDRAFT_777162 [Exidia glandulosa HHB12029]|uniref:Uncharacterized protein n=1 Tax=Exidia glandulosa HHB12029 TaxID=1314781 RepID=A0A165D5F0_EXIGL|nr:hypothetical protein EXIGLDRAFT_777162 [Exidia glandulosa HHB12029]
MPLHSQPVNPNPPAALQLPFDRCKRRGCNQYLTVPRLCTGQSVEENENIWYRTCWNNKRNDSTTCGNIDMLFHLPQGKGGYVPPAKCTSPWCQQAAKGPLPSNAACGFNYCASCCRLARPLIGALAPCPYSPHNLAPRTTTQEAQAQVSFGSYLGRPYEQKLGILEAEQAQRKASNQRASEALRQSQGLLMVQWWIKDHDEALCIRVPKDGNFFHPRSIPTVVDLVNLNKNTMYQVFDPAAQKWIWSSFGLPATDVKGTSVLNFRSQGVTSGPGMPQSSGRVEGDPVSPPRKRVASSAKASPSPKKSSTSSTAAQDVICISDSDDDSDNSVQVISTSFGGIKRELSPSAGMSDDWPTDYSTMASGLEFMNASAGKGKAFTVKGAFKKAFPGTVFKSSSYYTYRQYWVKAPRALKDEFAAMDGATWAAFISEFETAFVVMSPKIVAIENDDALSLGAEDCINIIKAYTGKNKIQGGAQTLRSDPKLAAEKVFLLNICLDWTLVFDADADLDGVDPRIAKVICVLRKSKQLPSLESRILGSKDGRPATKDQDSAPSAGSTPSPDLPAGSGEQKGPVVGPVPAGPGTRLSPSESSLSPSEPKPKRTPEEQNAPVQDGDYTYYMRMTLSHPESGRTRHMAVRASGHVKDGVAYVVFEDLKEALSELMENFHWQEDGDSEEAWLCLWSLEDFEPEDADKRLGGHEPIKVAILHRPGTLELLRAKRDDDLPARIFTAEEAVTEWAMPSPPISKNAILVGCRLHLYRARNEKDLKRMLKAAVVREQVSDGDDEGEDDENEALISDPSDYSNSGLESNEEWTGSGSDWEDDDDAAAVQAVKQLQQLKARKSKMAKAAKTRGRQPAPAPLDLGPYATIYSPHRKKRKHAERSPSPLPVEYKERDVQRLLHQRWKHNRYIQAFRRLRFKQRPLPVGWLAKVVKEVGKMGRRPEIALRRIGLPIDFIKWKSIGTYLKRDPNWVSQAADAYVYQALYGPRGLYAHPEIVQLLTSNDDNECLGLTGWVTLLKRARESVFKVHPEAQEKEKELMEKVVLGRKRSGATKRQK